MEEVKIRLSDFYRHISFLVKLLFSGISLYPVTDEESTLYGNDPTDAEGFELSPEARAQADLKFTYVVTCQIYGRQKEDQKPEAADIALLMQR